MLLGSDYGAIAVERRTNEHVTDVYEARVGGARALYR